ncbi:tol-pal system protein YbgF [Gemmatimonas aurantiaca]|uniref:tol-pal system protein YbgF n=1 Tax=Gemmatimonas aurantiaca TaxID=173480 RepID=UPI00301D2504
MRFHRVWRLVPLVALAATGGCFATRGDVRIVQNDVLSLRSEMLRQQQQHQESLSQTLRILQVASDSLARVSARTVTIQGDVRGEMRAVREQLLQVQTLLGQSQATISRLRAELEARNNAPMPTPTGAPSGPPSASGTPPVGSRNPPVSSGTPVDSMTPAPTGPGPNQLFTNGMDQLNRGSTSTARTLFQELITTYPTSDYVPDAQYWIAESLAKENNLPAADAAYAAVVSAHPTSAKAPTALYKRAQLLLRQNNPTQARQLFEQVMAKYPRSNEAALAEETLKTLR